MNDRLDWFPCEPAALLGALAGMPSPKKLTYLIMLLRIYESGGSCPDALPAIALRVGLNKRVVSEALDELFREGRLVRREGGIHNPKADIVIASSMAIRKLRQEASRKAGFQSAKKRKENQSSGPTSRSARVEQTSTPLQLQEQDSLFSNEKRVSDWPSDYQDWFWKNYPRREGKKAAMAKLDAIRKSGKVTWADFTAGVLRYAAHVLGTEQRYIKQPVTWLNQGCWDDEFKNGGTNAKAASPANGSTLGARLRQAVAAEQGIYDAAPGHEPGHGR